MNENENQSNQFKKFCKKNIAKLCWLSIVVGILFFASGGIIINFSFYTQGSIVITIGLGLISIGIGFLAIELSIKSDEKMKAISELNFAEKISMICGYIDDLEGLRGGHFIAAPSSTPDNKTISNEILKKMMWELDSALKVIDYISEETRDKFLSTFVMFSEAIKDHIPAFKEDDITSYLKILVLVKKYPIQDKENVLESLKILLEQTKKKGGAIVDR